MTQGRKGIAVQWEYSWLPQRHGGTKGIAAQWDTGIHFSHKGAKAQRGLLGSGVVVWYWLEV